MKNETVETLKEKPMLTRRHILSGLIVAPAVVKFASLMPVRGIIMPTDNILWYGRIQIPSAWYVSADYTIWEPILCEGGFAKYMADKALRERSE